MQVCTNCGASVREGAKFCTSCGTRLNEAISSTPPSSWSAPGGSETLVVSAVNPDNIPENAESADDAAIETASSSPPEEGFTWKWGDSSVSEENANASGSDVADEVSVETGAVPDEQGVGAEDAPAIVDATEDEILAEDPAVSDEPDAVPVAEDVEDVADHSTDESLDAIDESDDSTLAAWAGQWSEEENAFTAQEPVDVDASPSEPESDPVDAGDEEEDEDPAERAERLLAELQTILPLLGRAKPTGQVEVEHVVVSAAPGLSPLLLEDLDALSSSDSFDDVRDTIETTRSNPRDIDSMLKLAGNVDRLQALLADRDRMAGKIEELRTRLRGEVEGSREDQGDSL